MSMLHSARDSEDEEICSSLRQGCSNNEFDSIERQQRACTKPGPNERFEAWVEKNHVGLT
jgi:hypothetical protein